MIKEGPDNTLTINSKFRYLTESCCPSPESCCRFKLRFSSQKCTICNEYKCCIVLPVTLVKPHQESYEEVTYWKELIWPFQRMGWCEDTCFFFFRFFFSSLFSSTKLSNCVTLWCPMKNYWKCLSYLIWSRTISLQIHILVDNTLNINFYPLLYQRPVHFS